MDEASDARGGRSGADAAIDVVTSALLMPTMTTISLRSLYPSESGTENVFESEDGFGKWAEAPPTKSGARAPNPMSSGWTGTALLTASASEIEYDLPAVIV